MKPQMPWLVYTANLICGIFGVCLGLFVRTPETELLVYALFMGLANIAYGIFYLSRFEKFGYKPPMEGSAERSANRFEPDGVGNDGGSIPHPSSN